MAKLILPLDSGSTVFDTNDISYISGNSNYADVIFINKTKIMVCRTLKQFDKLEGFLRIGKSNIVNTSLITKITDSFVYLKTGETLPYSGARKDLIIKLGFITI